MLNSINLPAFVNYPHIVEMAYSAIGSPVTMTDKEQRHLVKTVVSASNGTADKNAVERALEHVLTYSQVDSSPAADIMNVFKRMVKEITKQAEGPFENTTCLVTTTMYAPVKDNLFMISFRVDGVMVSAPHGLHRASLQNFNPTGNPFDTVVSEVLAKRLGDFVNPAEFGWMVKVTKVFLFREKGSEFIRLTMVMSNVHTAQMSVTFKMRVDDHSVITMMASFVPADKEYSFPLSLPDEAHIRLGINMNKPEDLPESPQVPEQLLLEEPQNP